MQEIFQPTTTDTTINGLRIARNAMRLKLWENDEFAHRYLCHPERECIDGCTFNPNYKKLNLYNSELED